MPSKYMCMMLEYSNFHGEKNKSDSEFYSDVKRDSRPYLINKMKHLFSRTAHIQFISSKELKINGRAAYQLSANISLASDPSKPIKGIFTFINFHHHTAFIAGLPVLVTSLGATHDPSQAQTVHWKEYNKLLYSLRLS